jgi:hypothetical protein
MQKMPRDSNILKTVRESSLTEMLTQASLRATDRDARRVAAGVTRLLSTAGDIDTPRRDQEAFAIQLRNAFEIQTIEHRLLSTGLLLPKDLLLQLVLKMVLCLESQEDRAVVWIVISAISGLPTAGRRALRRASTYRPMRTFLAQCSRARRARSDALKSQAVLAMWAALARDLGYCLELAGSNTNYFSFKGL